MGMLGHRPLLTSKSKGGTRVDSDEFAKWNRAGWSCVCLVATDSAVAFGLLSAGFFSARCDIQLMYATKNPVTAVQ